MKRLFLLPVIVCAACGLVLLSTCKEEKEEPLHFETTAPTAYTFPETETSATFTIASNTAWTVEVTEGRDRCSVTPASGKSSATVTVRVTANPDYLQTHTMTLRLTAGDYTQDITITQAAPPCPDFNAGAIATAGQTVTVGGTPGTIGSAQAATGGDRHITYQWYKNGNVIEDATAASYTPPASVTATAGVNTYTRRAKDNTCNTTLTPSAGSWILTVVCPDFDPGTIAEAEQTINVGGTPETINSVQDASGAGSVTYQWYKNNIVISGATAAYYTPPPADATVVSANTYTRRAKDNTCNTTLTPSEGSWILTVICPFNSGTVAANGQTLNVGGTPETINSVQDAGGAGSVTYQWYKNNIAITGATDAYYTPPPTDATAVGAHTYTRRAKDNTCNTTLTPSEGSWVLTVVCPFNAGTIAATGQTIMIGGTPIAISSVQNASGIGTISYQWYKNDMAISGATDAYYTPPPTDATAVGAHTYTRRVKDNICNVTFTPSEGTWILTVVCPSFNPGAIATDGQTINVGGTPETINSVQDASGAGSVIYQWYKNNIVISGATAAYYTPPPADATVVSANTYTRRAKDNTCNTTLTPSEGSWVLTVVCPDFSPGAIATAGQAICSGNAVNTIPNSTNASGGDNNIFYQWRRNSITISDATATTYSPVAFNATVGSHIFTRWAKDGVCTTDWTQSAGQWVLEVTGRPQLTLTTANDNQVVTVGTAIEPIQYVTANATGTTSSGLPADVSGVWDSNTYTISGTPTSTGIFNYMVSTTNSNGCANTAASGAITVNVAATTPPDAASTQTWVFGSQTWSDRVVKSPANCIQTTKLSSESYPPAQYLVSGGRYYYNWTCVYDNKDSFCPSPWSLPSDADFVVLQNNTTGSMLLYYWGADGRVFDDKLSDVDADGWLWTGGGSSSYVSATSLWYGNSFVYVTNLYTGYGLQLRCVKW